MFVRPLRRVAFLFACAFLFINAQTARAGALCGSPGDGDGDCRVSLFDHADFAGCLTGPAVLAADECSCYDMDADGDVDLRDAQLFQGAFTGDALIAGCVLPVREDEPGTLRPEKSGTPEVADWGIPSSSTNDSVYGFSGEFHISETDMVIRGRGFDFEWTRCYRSKIGPNTTMGNGWDYNYNIWLEPSGGNLILHDGTGRSDEYCINANGRWMSPEFFREISVVPGGYQMVSHDRTTYLFSGFNGLPEDGKLIEISDPNNNSMLFEYDPVLGRLTAIHDTLASAINVRAVNIAYNQDGRISSITDFTGRQVTYAYYQNIDVGGDDGDLRSVTTPAVVGTPNGNDFPQGKTTEYTYSEGSPDPRLNHNLLTITDPKGQTYLENVYSPSLSPQDINYDRLLTQRCGSPNELFTFFYQAQLPSPANNFATTMCIVNDRMGNVEECYYDYRNRLAMCRRLTGRANPVAQTTDVQNRPVNPLRASDPPYFETRYEYNQESLLTRVFAPEGDELRLSYYGDVSPTIPARRKCELNSVTRVPGPRGGKPGIITQLYEYDVLLNGDTGQVTLYTDGKNNRTRFEYDGAGNRVRTTAAIPSIVDDYAYNAFGQMTLHTEPDNGSGVRKQTEWVFYPQVAGASYGYLQQKVVDPAGLALTTAYDYDAVGNVTRMTDANGNASDYTYNALDQVVQTLSPQVAPQIGPRYESLTYYDANDNIIQVDIENRDAQGNLSPNAYFTKQYEYDILNCVTRTIEEVDAANNVVTEYDFDANRNPTVTRFGEATNGNQPTNTLTRVYDERDLLFHMTRAAGDPAASTTQYDYDQNGNITLERQGLQGAAPRDTTYAYDGYNRITITGATFGNELHRAYDANNNIESETVLGELLDVPGDAGNVRLAETVYQYDPINRLTIRGAQFFDAAQAPLTDGESTTTFAYSDSSHMLSVTDDNGHVTSCTYDSVNRRDVCTDGKGSTIEYVYDNNSNVTQKIATDHSDIGLGDEVFTNTFVYDGLNRITLKGDNFGNTRVSLYDSRDLVEQEVDALGNTREFNYDGLERLTSTSRVLTDTGAGGGVVVGVIVNDQVWDDSSRLIEQTDGNGNTTFINHDPLNRPAFKNFADGTTETYEYDVHDNITRRIDAMGTRIDYAYDPQNRLTIKGITPAQFVSSDTTFELYDYDGLDRIVRAEDDDSVVLFEYDSLSNMVSETLQGVTTTSSYDGLGNQTQCVYPGGRVIDRAYNGVNRLSSISENGSSIATFSYVGAGRKQFRQLGNGSQTFYAYDGVTGVPNPAGDFGVGLPVSITHLHPITGQIDAREYRWDPMYNRTVRSDSVSLIEHEFEYDSTYRLTRTVVTDNSPPGPTPVRDTDYTLDLASNRTQVTNDNCPGPYTLDPTNPPADAQMNQYTTTGCDSRLYDANGNLTTRLAGNPVSRDTYDYKDRLISHTNFAQGTTTTMAYDALGRRISQEQIVGAPVSLIEYFYDGDNVILEQDGASNTTYVYGDGTDEIIEMVRGSSEFYYHTDDLGTVLAVTDSNGLPVERYAYQDYGQPEFFDGAGLPIPSSSIDNPYLFTGRRYDSATGLYYYRARYLDPVAGRFISRDPRGMWFDWASPGNAYAYAGSNPWTFRDPSGAATNAQDYNSSRSNNINGMAAAQDYNSSRSNNINGMADAQDYNSSRSNNINGMVEAQDYNSSRSNNINGIVAPPPGNGGMMCGETDHLLAGGGTSCPADNPYRCWDGSCRRSMTECPAATQTDIAEYTGTSQAVARGGHHGHVTVLKMCGGAEGADYNSSRSNKTHTPSYGSGTGGGGGGGRASDGKGYEFRGHVTVLKMCGVPGGGGPASGMDSGIRKRMGVALSPGHGGSSGRATGRRQHGPMTVAGNNHCPRCGAMLCRCKDGPTRGPGDGKKRTHRGHVTVLKLYGAASGGGGGGLTGSSSETMMSAGVICCHGYVLSKCPHSHILPAANNIPSR
ncbi:MAG: RHS repeat protein [Phycisphaerales bacterium]|nr:RHS repeat protein [Phycisphaerales bacterium]